MLENPDKDTWKRRVVMEKTAVMKKTDSYGKHGHLRKRSTVLNNIDLKIVTICDIINSIPQFDLQ